MVSVVYVWFCRDSKQKQFSEQTEMRALLSAFSPSFISLFFLSLSFISDQNSPEAE